MIEQALAKKVLTVALQTGGDFAELYVEDTEKNTVSMQGGVVENANYSRIHGAGVRVMLGTNTAYAYTAGTEEGDLLKAAQSAAAAIKGDKIVAPMDFTVTDYQKTPKIPASTVSNERRIELLRKGSDAAKGYSDEITQTTADITDIDKRVLVCNSEGLFALDRRPSVRIAVSAVATADGEAQSGREAPGYATGYECFERIDVEQLGKNVAKTAVTMLHGKECPAGVFPVVIDGGFGGVIFHEACGHSLEATSVALGNSEFCGKIGQLVANERVTAIDDGTMAGEWGSLSIDDEGKPQQRRVLIENGVLKSYMIDRLGARRMGTDSTASARRQDYTFAPTSRMSNTFIAEGSDNPDEMIATMGTGLYAKSMGGGSVNPLTGEFNFAVDEGYWVKDGKIVCAVRGATLIGKGTDVLKKIDRVGPKMTMAPGMCGSLSGAVPTNVGQPRIRVTDITVGGKGGEI